MPCTLLRPGKVYSFEILVEVHNTGALFRLALRRLMEDGLDEIEAVDTLKPEGEIDPAVCLRMILDPSSLDGCSILDSNCV